MNIKPMIGELTKSQQLLEYIWALKLRVFKREELENSSRQEISFSYSTFGYMLKVLCKQGHLINLRKGLYQVVACKGSDINNYEIGMALINPAMISHISAFNYHGLQSNQSLRVHITTSCIGGISKSYEKGKAVITVRNVDYKFIQSKEKFYLGEEAGSIGDAHFKVTDLERTLLDGLRHPKYCGGLQEVINAYQRNLYRIKLEKIISYALHFEIAVIGRLGWLLEKLGVEEQALTDLMKPVKKGYRPLDPNCPREGACNKKWGLQINSVAAPL